jgi:hypothetical protein
MGNKKRDTKKEKANCLLTILFQKLFTTVILLNCHLEVRQILKKMPNTILPLVVLTWLQQLQEYFLEIGDNKEIGDWNGYGKYCAVKARHVSKEFPLDNVHMMKANSTSLVKADSFTCIKPDSQNIKPDSWNNKIVVKSLEEWAAKILCRDNNDYVRNIANSDEETKKCFQRTEKHGLTKYTMTEISYKPNKDHTSDSVDIGTFTPQQQWNKTEEQLFLRVSNFIKDKIETLEKKAHKKNANQKDIKLLNRANKAAACLVELYNKKRDEDFSTLVKMEECMQKIETNQNNKKFASESSEQSSESEQDK